MFQNHEAEPPMATVIRQDIYEDLKPQDKNQDWCGVSLCVGRFSCMLGNSEGPWEGLAAGTAVMEAKGPRGIPVRALPMPCQWPAGAGLQVQGMWIMWAIGMRKVAWGRNALIREVIWNFLLGPNSPHLLAKQGKSDDSDHDARGMLA